MVHRCCISSCKINVRQAEAKGLSYHTFPTNNIHREKWIQAILAHVEKPETFKVVQNYTRICSRHFRNSEYSYDSKKRARLNSSAVPTIFTRKNTTPLVQSTESIKQAKLEDDTLSSSANLDFGISLNLSEQDEPTLASHTSSMRSPSSLEIDKLVYDFRSSLFTNNLPDALDPLDLSELRLPLPPSFSDDDSFGIDLRDSLLSNVDILTQDLNIYLSTGSSVDGRNQMEKVEKRDQAAAAEQVTKGGGTNKCGGSKKGSVPKRKLSGISKTPKKKDKNFGLFSVERFRDSDKDIEYYTGFPSYSHFEAFFNSLENHVEKLKVTDIMHGYNAVHGAEETRGPNAGGDGVDWSCTDTSDFPETEQKRMLKQGRSMSRIDEFFMTLVRLKRRLPEKIIGHMFLVSQPTVSRVIRAWTMLLFKLFEPIPSTSGIKKKTQGSGLKSKITNLQQQEEEEEESNVGSIAKNQINYFTKKGIYVPDSFRQLFRTEVALSIISSAQSPRQSTASSTNSVVGGMNCGGGTMTTTTTTAAATTTEGNNNNIKDVSKSKDNSPTSTTSTTIKQEDIRKSPTSLFPSYSFPLEDCEEGVKISFHDSDLIGSCDDLYQSLLVNTVRLEVE